MKLDLTRFDSFGQSVPNLTLRGRDTIGTYIGFIGSVVLWVCMSIFGTIKFIQFQTYRNPQIVQAKEFDVYTTCEEVVNIDELNFKLAFTIENEDGEVLDDPYYVQFMAMISTYIDETDNGVQFVGIHKCTDHDKAQFYPAAKNAAKTVKNYFDSNSLYCFDDLDLEGDPWNKNLFGPNDDTAYRMINVLYQPCIPE